MFDEELVLITPKSKARIATPSDLGSTTLIAFAHGCSYRKRVEQWLAENGKVPDRVLELASYHAMIACVAAGTGFAVVPKSVLATLRSAACISQHTLPKRIAFSRTHLVWHGEPSSSLHALLAICPQAA